jgi:tRNA threonylcarbamoyladenosine biosynthesis protein TsaE
LADTGRLAKRLVDEPLPSVWLLRGPLGSGKTALARSVLRALGWRGRVTSPTFVLRHDFTVKHPRWKHVVHVDAYRVRGLPEEAALDLVSAAEDPGCLIMIEWPEKLRQLPGRRPLTITLSHQPRGRRIVFSRPV